MDQLLTGQTCDGGKRTLRWSQLCDGIVDCHDRSDEEGRFCQHCVNNLYSCPPKDDIRCDLACKMLHYVPCQTIQDRRACRSIARENSMSWPLQWFNECKVYFALALGILAALIVFVMLVRYLIRSHQRRLFKPSSKISTCPDRTIETDALSTHTYEQCYEPPPYEIASRYPSDTRYYEHAV